MRIVVVIGTPKTAPLGQAAQMEFNSRMLFICPAKRYFRPDKMTIITDERCTAYHSPGHPERPFRVSGPVKKLKEQTDLKLQWLKPEPAPKAKVLRRSEEHTSELQSQ